MGTHIETVADSRDDVRKYAVIMCNITH